MRGARIIGMLLCTLGLWLPNATSEGLNSTAPTPLIVVFCDRAALPSGHRQDALAQAEKVLTKAGFVLKWVDQGCVGPALASYFTMVILPEYPRDWPLAADAMGAAPVLDGPYPRAYVFLDLVRNLDRRNRPEGDVRSMGILLGHAMAHELGHLLGHEHTKSGIMRAQWGREEWLDAMTENLLFLRPRFARLNR